MKTAIVTGATGFIGVHLCEELLKNGVKVTAFVRSGSKNVSRLPSGVDLEYFDMDSYSSLDFPSADVFYHLAWEGATGAERGNPLLQSKNAERTIEALNAAIRNKCGKFIALGTVYEKLLPQVNSFEGFRQADYYLISKNYAHAMCSKIAYQHNMQFIWASIFQPIGKYIKQEQMTAYVIKCLINNKTPVLGTGIQPYDITAVENIALGLRLLGECDVPEREYYIGGGAPKFMRDYIEELHRILNSKVSLRFGERADDGLMFDFDWYDIHPIVRDTGYYPIVDFNTAIFSTFHWLNEFPK